MPTVTHSNLTSPDAIHPAAYVASTDPGALGAHKFWVDTSGTAPYKLKKRNSLNTTWELVGSGGAQVRLRKSSTQSIASSATATAVTWDTEDTNTDTQHYVSTGTLTGTVSKSSSTATTTLTGIGTLFTTELSVGQAISVPGGATETKIVTAIASATSLTVATAFTQTASGQTATRINSPIAMRTAGFYVIQAGILWASSLVGTLQIRLNGATIIGQGAPDFSSVGCQQVLANYNFAQWDYIEVLVSQLTGAAVNVSADQRTFFAVKL